MTTNNTVTLQHEAIELYEQLQKYTQNIYLKRTRKIKVSLHTNSWIKKFLWGLLKNDVRAKKNLKKKNKSLIDQAGLLEVQIYTHLGNYERNASEQNRQALQKTVLNAQLFLSNQ